VSTQFSPTTRNKAPPQSLATRSKIHSCYTLSNVRHTPCLARSSLNKTSYANVPIEVTASVTNAISHTSPSRTGGTARPPAAPSDPVIYRYSCQRTPRSLSRLLGLGGPRCWDGGNFTSSDEHLFRRCNTISLRVMIEIDVKRGCEIMCRIRIPCISHACAWAKWNSLA
jgi:hypothetical protein